MVGKGGRLAGVIEVLLDTDPDGDFFRRLSPPLGVDTKRVVMPLGSPEVLGEAGREGVIVAREGSPQIIKVGMKLNSQKRM